MGVLWGWIIHQTAHSPGRLMLFGGLCVGVTAVIGNIFTGAMAPDPKTQLNGLGYDDQRAVSGRDQRLSNMIRDMVEGNGDQHWNAAMRGTLVPHPMQENKTQGIDNLVLAKKK